ncbi:hypothetical protein C0995_010961 [Termitomyces sp. Mi166|nr:hypothetical protein C0995_010961 [Termitomyces sp. Mi166\
MLSRISALVQVITLALSTSAQQNGLLVPTLQGSVNGILSYPSVRQFLGIPYATARRWEPPSLPPNRSETLNTTQFSDSCLQTLTPTAIEYLRLAGFNDSAIFVPESEDCLRLNIWTPSIDRKQNAAVLLWVYGGGFQFGTSNFPAYTGRNIVRDNDDILIVTFNYRLNIFGFPNAPQLMNTSYSQNFGLLDIDAAIQWVYDNIAAFGGDPERIVLFGQSAGGIAIDAYTLANTQDTRVKGIIEESGNLGVLTAIEALGPLSPIPILPQPWNTVANKVECGNGITIFADAQARAAAGNFLHVPLLGGSNKNEADLLLVATELLTTGFTVPAVTEGITARNWFNAHVPSWRYQYEGIFPDISTRSDLRAYHTAEIPLVFGTMTAPTDIEVALSKFIQSAWVTFARDPTQGLVSLGWPRYSPDTSTLALIGNSKNQTGLILSSAEIIDLPCNSTSTLLSTVQQLETKLGL